MEEQQLQENNSIEAEIASAEKLMGRQIYAGFYTCLVTIVSVLVWQSYTSKALEGRGYDEIGIGIELVLYIVCIWGVKQKSRILSSMMSFQYGLNLIEIGLISKTGIGIMPLVIQFLMLQGTAGTFRYHKLMRENNDPVEPSALVDAVSFAMIVVWMAGLALIASDWLGV